MNKSYKDSSNLVIVVDYSQRQTHKIIHRNFNTSSIIYTKLTNNKTRYKVQYRLQSWFCQKEKYVKY